jgi:hypothetical protein
MVTACPGLQPVPATWMSPPGRPTSGPFTWVLVGGRSVGWSGGTGVGLVLAVGDVLGEADSEGLGVLNGGVVGGGMITGGGVLGGGVDGGGIDRGGGSSQVRVAVCC